MTTEQERRAFRKDLALALAVWTAFEFIAGHGWFPNNRKVTR